MECAQQQSSDGCGSWLAARDTPAGAGSLQAVRNDEVMNLLAVHFCALTAPASRTRPITASAALLEIAMVFGGERRVFELMIDLWMLTQGTVGCKRLSGIGLGEDRCLLVVLGLMKW